MAIRKVQSSRDGLYSINLPKDLAESLGITKQSKVDIRMKGQKLELMRV
jgi:antitoxin component of MazEF toxin-antitoxin module